MENCLSEKSLQRKVFREKSSEKSLQRKILQRSLLPPNTQIVDPSNLGFIELANH